MRDIRENAAEEIREDPAKTRCPEDILKEEVSRKETIEKFA